MPLLSSQAALCEFRVGAAGPVLGESSSSCRDNRVCEGRGGGGPFLGLFWPPSLLLPSSPLPPAGPACGLVAAFSFKGGAQRDAWCAFVLTAPSRFFPLPCPRASLPLLLPFPNQLVQEPVLIWRAPHTKIWEVRKLRPFRSSFSQQMPTCAWSVGRSNLNLLCS